MKKISLFLICILAGGSLQAQEVQRKYGEGISPAKLKEYLSILASDALEGRKTGTRGQKMAAALIADHFQEIGLTPPVNDSYYQKFEMYTASVRDAHVTVEGSRFDNNQDIIYLGLAETAGEITQDIVFTGRGSQQDFDQVDVSGKAVLLLAAELGGSIVAFRSLAETSRAKGAVAVFIVTESSPEEFRSFAEIRKEYSANGAGKLSFEKPDPYTSDKGIFLLNRSVAEKLFHSTLGKLKKAADDPRKSLLKKIKPAKIGFQVSLNVSTLRTENVIGYLEGSDKKSEIVIVTAHYDHIGTTPAGEDRINNGADDDGSGTVSVLEIASAFANAKREGHGPRRSMVFMTVAGEEQGLLGSQYYVDHPVYPLASTVVDLNIDMIGRTDLEHKDNPNYVYVIGSDKLSTELHQINEQANAAYTKLSFDYTYNDEHHPTNLYQRSDHWNFAKNGVPIVFYFDGIHEDYHRPSDEVAKINFDLLATRAQCVFYTAWEVANREQRIQVDKK